MGIHVVLMQVTQPGTSPKRRRLTWTDSVQDDADLFSGLCVNSRLPMLNRMDPYRTHILTPADMPQFLSELEATRTLVNGLQEQNILDKIRTLAKQCAETTSLELHLQGD
ncbi:hypothetical protein [Streptomyces sp. WG-D5]